MSDGGASFPESSIKKLVNDKKIIDKIEFHSVAFGSEADKTILKKIADSFPNGKLSDAPTAEALNNTFIKLIPSKKPV
jgi:hypothetical protein